MLGRLTPWKPSQPAIDVAFELVRAAVVPVADHRALGLEVMQRDVVDLEMERPRRSSRSPIRSSTTLV